MENTNVTESLPKFVRHVSQSFDGHERPLTINDLRLCIRTARMSEISDWSNHDLDGIELHASKFDGYAPLETVFSKTPESDSAVFANVSSICSPSPFAWT
jgi:hypothetical protein